jgi:LysR family hydrogen peroxide-inducible transcriptional activator
MARGAGPSEEFQASSLSTLVQTVAAGAGITLVPQMALEVEGRSELRLKFVPFPKPAPSRTICLAWRRASPRGDEFRLLGEQLVQNVPRARRRLSLRRR